MLKHKRILSLVLSAVMLFGCVSALPLTGSAASVNTMPAGNLVSAAAQEKADGFIVSFSKAVSDKKIETIVEEEDAQVESISKIGSVKLAAVSVDADWEETAEALADNRAVKAVQPNWRYTVAADDPYIGTDVTPFNQYQFEATNAFAAWTELESGTHAKTRVAVVDTGIDLNHEDLQANVLKEDGKYAHFGLGELQMAEDDFDEEDGHGTHVSGIIAAEYGNDKGGSGIASGHNNDLVELMTVSASVDGYSLFSIDIIKAIDYAVNHGAKVVNMSFGSGIRDLMMDSVIQDAYYNKGVVFVAASGNEDYEGYSSPSDLKEVISINASNRFNEPTYYSNYGTEKDILAPGNSIMSTLPGSDYGIMSGTSMASPVAAGIAALVRDANPDLTPAQVYNILCASAQRSNETLFESSYGFGVIDALAAVKAAKAAKADIPVESVNVKSDTVTVQEGNTYGAEALVLPATSLAPISWSVADTSIATVDAATGVITALKEGETTITVAAGGKSATQKLIVEPTIAITDIMVTGIPEDGVLAVGEMIMVDTSLVPSNATFTDVYVKSSDDSIVAASDGVFVGMKCGTCTISVESWDGAVKKDYPITVKNAPVKVKFTKTADWLFMGESFTFEAKGIDEDGNSDVAGDTIEYTSTNKKVFTIEEETGVITPVAPGKAFVKATNAYGQMVAKQVTIAKTDYKGADYGLKQTKASRTAVTLAWNKVPVASGYQIDYKTAGGSWKKFTTASAGAESYHVTKLKPGTVYYFRIKALYKKNGTTNAFSYSSTIDGRTTPDYLLKQTAKTKNSVTLKWSKVPSAAGYQIQYKARKTAAWKTVKSVGAKTLSYKHSGLKAGKTVYYRVRAYYKVSGNVHYFGYSAAITAKSAK